MGYNSIHIKGESMLTNQINLQVEPTSTPVQPANQVPVAKQDLDFMEGLTQGFALRYYQCSSQEWEQVLERYQNQP